MPAKAIGARFVPVPHEVGRRAFSEPNLDTPFPWILDENDAPRYLNHEGDAVFNRPDKPRAIHALHMREQGARVVAEVDDNYLAPRDQNLFMRQTWTEGTEQREHLEAMACFDAIVVTTPYLRDQYARGMRKLLRNLGTARPEFHVIGNHLDPDDWGEPVPPREDGKLRIGWMGSASHLWDLKLAYPALKWAADQGHEVMFIGHDPQWWPQSRVRNTAGARTFGFPYTHIPWTDPRELDRKQAWPLDIGLCPLRRDGFGLGKSDVKFLEMTRSGAATIASSGTVYESIRHGETGLLASSMEDMWRHVQTLATDPKLRRELVANAQQYVREERLITQHVGAWREAIHG